MECPMCYEIYDEQIKIPRNLLCGHTYCEFCLVNVLKSKGRLECPICRFKHDGKIRPNELTKNYVALEFSLKQRQLLQKHEMCGQHKEPLRFYCQNDSQYICIDCITKHTGHRFFKQQQSIVLVRRKLSQRVGVLKQEMQRIQGYRSRYEQARGTLSGKYEQAVSQVDRVIQKARRELEQTEDRLYGQLKKYYDNELLELDQSKGELDRESQLVERQIKNLQEKMESLEKMKLLEEKVDVSDYKPRKFKNPLNTEFPTLAFTCMELPKMELNYRVNPKICFFGDRKRLLTYCPVTNTYNLTNLVTHIEIPYFCACCTLPSGQIIITGGGSTNVTILFNAWSNSKLTLKKNMISCRKQHSCVYMNGLVYAIGGYDSKNKCMAGCQVYDLNKDEWRSITGLNVPRCAFAVAVARNKIWVMGGFDGIQQIKSIQVYEETTASWKLLNVELRQPLANSAAVLYENTIIILGGGCNEGFSLEAYQLDLDTMAVAEIARMETGRDLRNKAIVYDGAIYALGGNNFSAQKYRVLEYRWQPLRGYGDLVQDNLDSWCCGLTYNLNDYDMDKFSQYNNNLRKKYLEYAYEEHERYDQII